MPWRSDSPTLRPLWPAAFTCWSHSFGSYPTRDLNARLSNSTGRNCLRLNIPSANRDCTVSHEPLVGSEYLYFVVSAGDDPRLVDAALPPAWPGSESRSPLANRICAES